jgi:curved DNA-binding protein CbpA
MNEIIKSLNPYEELGVHPDASEAHIRSVYRAQAKIHHPDAGGDPEAWARMKRAYDVLMDPKLRKTFDETGRVEEDRPDNDRAAAMQIIEMQFGTLLNEFLLAMPEHAARLDPRKRNVMHAIMSRIRDELDQAEGALPRGREVLAFYADMKARFTLKNPAGENFFAAQMDKQTELAEEQIRGLEGNIRVRKVALDIMREYDFRYDAPAPMRQDASMRRWDAPIRDYDPRRPISTSFGSFEDD